MTISANVRTPEQLFGRSVRYVVPAYQRRYVWNEQDQWEPLWEDVERLADAYLDLIGNGDTQVSEDDAPKHFLGAVVFQQEVTPAGSIEIRRVIDGQQRLTTLQILLDAVQEVYEQQAHELEARRLQRLVLNDELDTGGDEVAGYKVWPSENDQQEFRFAMRNDATGPRPEDSLIVDAHDYFKEQVTRWLTEQTDLETAVAGLSVVLARMLQLVVIDLDADAEPQVIFETLNARGTPLLQADLVRNYMILKAKAEGLDEDAFNREWLLPFNTQWWQEQVRFGRYVRARFEQFLYYWIMMRTARDIRVDDVFRGFQRYVDDEVASIESVAAEIKQSAEVFEWLEGGDSTKVSTRWYPYLSTRQQLDISVDTPVMLWLFKQNLPQATLELVMAAFESWYVRRILWGRLLTSDNRVLMALLARLVRSEDGEATADTVVDFFKNQEADRMSWTDDDEFFRTLAGVKSYGRLSRARVLYLLSRIESHLRTSQAEDVAWLNNIQIEHVMPRKWQKHWPLTGQMGEGFTSEEEYRDYVLNCLGNLTLITGKLNSSVSNGPWKRKRKALDRHSVLFLNKDVLDQGKDSWSVDDIEERSERLAKLALEIWPGPDKF
ncbi:MAG: DUF262 domain-containing protein [Chloroflexota bacterium]|nr:DUF262 domain-containing protein [Chloroflexota bacterium]MDE2896532.1 DUF262 domain-containing protein [Chloroflexota bacterium]